MRAPVAAVPPRPPRFGLLAAAPTLTDGRWQEGWEFQPEACGVSGRVAPGCSGATAALEADYGPATVHGVPFVVWASDRCGTLGSIDRDYAGRARRQLEATRSYEMANELWEGTLGLDNPAFVDLDSDVLTAGPATVLDALGCMEQGLAACYRGRQGMIHVTPQVLVHMAQGNLITLSGNTWLSPGGHVIVGDAGYTGNGPAGQPATTLSQWIFGTSLIGVRLGGVQVFGPDQTSFDRDVNDQFALAQQLVGIQSDWCCFVAAEVNVGLCLTGGVS